MGKVKSRAKSSTMSTRAYARHRGVTPAAVVKAKKSRRISTEPNGRIDPDKADREWKANTDPSRNPGRQAKTTGASSVASTAQAGSLPPYQDSRAFKEAYLARLVKLDYDVRTGRYVNLDKVKVELFNAARIARDIILSLPDRVSQTLVAMNDEREIHEYLTNETRTICHDLAEGVKNVAAD